MSQTGVFLVRPGESYLPTTRRCRGRMPRCAIRHTREDMDPFALLAAHTDITLLRRQLPGNEKGRWYPEQRVIVLQVGMTQRQERCTLMHELAHAFGNDTRIEDTRLAARQERACHERVARVLISIEALVREAQWASDNHQLAEALDVDLETLLMRIDTLEPAEIEMFYSSDVGETA